MNIYKNPATSSPLPQPELGHAVHSSGPLLAQVLLNQDFPHFLMERSVLFRVKLVFATTPFSSLDTATFFFLILLQYYYY
jgi:hypothetical protein